MRTRTEAARKMARVAAHYSMQHGVTVEEVVAKCIRTALADPAAMPPFVRDYLAENPALTGGAR